MWPVAEMRKVVLDAGFTRTVVCIDSVDETGYAHKYEPLSTEEEFERARTEDRDRSSFTVSPQYQYLRVN